MALFDRPDSTTSGGWAQCTVPVLIDALGVGCPSEEFRRGWIASFVLSDEDGRLVVSMSEAIYRELSSDMGR